MEQRRVECEGQMSLAQVCAECGGLGGWECDDCDGKGKDCVECDGWGWFSCEQCDGSGVWK